ncbi:MULTISPECIES: RNA polymerase sigma factor [unclassified Brevundimonas]|uniref:RNA polymerase sigma factor n=1 Tax=unclassified Brevundimonas TaxID=2622653 RepID=UPI00391712F7
MIHRHDNDRWKAAQGDRRAFSALMAATSSDLYRFIRRYVGDAHEAHDLLQETYASAWLAIRRYDPQRPFEIWLRSIAVNKCRDWGRKRTVRRIVRRIVRGVMGLDAPEALAVGEDTAGAEDRLDDRRRLIELDRALADLPATLKEPLLLAAIEGRSHAEIAGILGVTTKAVETRIARARHKLSLALNV